MSQTSLEEMRTLQQARAQAHAAQENVRDARALELDYAQTTQLSKLTVRQSRKLARTLLAACIPPAPLSAPTPSSPQNSFPRLLP